MAKSKKPTGPQKPSRLADNHRAKKWRPPEPEYLDWRTVDLSKLAYAENFALKEELATFKGHLEELLRDEGKYVLIKGREVIGIYDDAAGGPARGERIASAASRSSSSRSPSRSRCTRWVASSY